MTETIKQMWRVKRTAKAFEWIIIGLDLFSLQSVIIMDREPWKYKEGWYCSVSLTGNLLGYDYRLTYRSKQSCEIWWSISHNQHAQCGECSSFICSGKDVAKINEFIQDCDLGRIWKWEINGACKKKKKVLYVGL